MRTFTYVAISLVLCFAIGYPVAYYLARYAGRTKGILLACIVLPFWMSYLMRMLAWVNLLNPEGAGPRTRSTRCTHRSSSRRSVSATAARSGSANPSR